MTKRGKKRLAALVGALAIVGAAVGGGYVVHRSQVRGIMQRGLEEGTAAFEAKDYALAMERLNDYAGRNQDNPEVMLMLAKARREIPLANGRHLSRAVSFAQSAASLAPGDPRAHELLIELYAELGLAGERVRAADDLLRIDPASEVAMLARAETLAFMGRVQDALSQARALHDRAPDNVRGTALLLDLMLKANHPPQEVRELVDAATERNRQDVDHALVRASVLATLHEAEESIAEARRAATLPAATAEQIDRVVSLLDRLGLESDASAYLTERGKGLGVGSDLAVVAAERAWCAGDVAGAAAFLSGVVDDPKPHTDNALGWAAFLAQAAGSLPSHADQELRERASGTARAWARTLDGARAMAAGAMTEARDALVEAVDLGRQDRVASALLGEVYVALGDPDGAIRIWEALVRERPRWLTVRISLVNALLRRGRIEDAHQQAAATWTLWRDRLLTSMLLARTSVAMVESGRATDALRRDAVTLVAGLKQEAAAKGDATVLEARLFASIGDNARAQAAIDEILRKEAEPADSDILALADLARAKGLSGADQLLALAEARNAANPDVALAAARRSAAAGRVDEGKALLRGGHDKATGPAKREWERRLASFLDEVGDPAGQAMLQQAAVANVADASAQLDLLTSRGVWADETTVSAAVERLKGITGESSLPWRIYEARRLLTFTPTDDRAAKAIELLGPVLQANGAHVGALTLMAEAYQRVTPPNNERSVEMLARAADADPAQAMIRVRHIALLQQMGRTEEAGRRLRDLAASFSPDMTLRRARADLFARQAMWREAEADLRAIAETGDATALAALAGAQAKQGRNDDARATLARVLEAPNPSPSTLSGAAMLLAQLGDVAAGERALAALPASVPPDARAVYASQFYEALDDQARAEQTLRDAMKAGATADLWSEWIAWLVRRGRAEEAQQAVASASKVYPNHPGIQRAAQAVSLAGQGDDIDILALAARTDADPALRALGEAARSFKESGDRAAYVTRLESVRQQYPTALIVRRELIRALRDLGDETRAEQEAISTASAMPTSDLAAKLAAETLAELGKLDNALAMARQWRERSLEAPEDAEIAIGQIEAMAGRPKEALAALEKWKDKIVAAADKSPQPLIVYARQLAIVGRVSDADTILRPRAEKDPYWASAYAAVGRVLVHDPALARTWLSDAEAFIGSDTRARLLLGQAWFDLAGRTRDTSDLQAVVRALSGLESSEKAAAGLLLATTYDLLGEFSEAERCYRLALEALPDNAAALNNFAYLLIKSGGSATEAEAMADRAVAAAQREGLSGGSLAGLYHTLGEARLRAGRLPQAEQAFNQGLALDPSSPHLLLGLVETHLKAERKDDAASAMQRLNAALRAGVPDEPGYKDRLAAAQAAIAGN